MVPEEKLGQFALGTFPIPSSWDLELEALRVGSVKVQWQGQEIELKKCNGLEERLLVRQAYHKGLQVWERGLVFTVSVAQTSFSTMVVL